MRCNKVNELLSLVAELRVEVERLRSIRDYEEEIGGAVVIYPLDKCIYCPHHKKQRIPYPLTTKQEEGTLEMEGSRKGFLSGKSPPTQLPRCPYAISMRLCNLRTREMKL